MIWMDIFTQDIQTINKPLKKCSKLLVFATSNVEWASWCQKMLNMKLP